MGRDTPRIECPDCKKEGITKMVKPGGLNRHRKIVHTGEMENPIAKMGKRRTARQAPSRKPERAKGEEEDKPNGASSSFWGSAADDWGF